MTEEKNYIPATALTIMVRLDNIQVQAFKKINRSNSKRINLAKVRLQNRGFSLDELCEIAPFNRRSGYENSKNTRHNYA